MKEREIRIATAELRVIPGDGAPTKISGHAARFNSLSEDLGGFRERIAPGAFAKTILSADVRALWNHDANIVLGRNKSGTLRMSEDGEGLHFEVDMPDTQLVRDMVIGPISRGDVNQCSFGFYTLADRWDKIDGEWIRTLLDTELTDVSPVTYPAYRQTDVAVRSMQAAIALQVPVEIVWRNDSLRKRLDLVN